MFGEWMGEDAIKIYEGGQAMTKEQAIQELERFNREGRIFATSVHEAIDIAIKTTKENSAEILQKNTELAEKNAEIEQKDRQIDLMAETIRKLAISLANYKGSYNKETINFTGNKGIKQYFERKVKK